MAKYYIRRTRHFYGPKKRRDIMCDDIGDALRFDSRAEAETWIEKENASLYYLAHNEYERPDLEIVTGSKLPKSLR